MFNASHPFMSHQALIDQTEQEAEAIRQAELEKEKEREAIQKKAKDKKDKKGRKSPGKGGSPSKTETPPPRKTFNYFQLLPFLWLLMRIWQRRIDLDNLFFKMKFEIFFNVEFGDLRNKRVTENLQL